MQDSNAKLLPIKTNQGFNKKMQGVLNSVLNPAFECRGKGKVKEKMRVERAIQMRRCDLDVLGGDPVHTHLIKSRLGPPDSFDVQ